VLVMVTLVRVLYDGAGDGREDMWRLMGLSVSVSVSMILEMIVESSSSSEMQKEGP